MAQTFRTLSFLAVLCFAPVMASAGSFTITGNTFGSLATGTATTTFNSATNTFAFILTNTSPFDARITGVGFDLAPTGFGDSTGLDGFIGANVGSFTFRDGALGNVPQFNSAVLDFGWTTGNNSNFSGGFPNNGIAPGNSLAFSVTGAGFTGFTDSLIGNSMYVRFQRVGGLDLLSDVGRSRENPPPVVPEPASLTLLGSGLIGITTAIRRRRAQKKQA